MTFRIDIEWNIIETRIIAGIRYTTPSCIVNNNMVYNTPLYTYYRLDYIKDRISLYWNKCDYWVHTLGRRHYGT